MNQDLIVSSSVTINASPAKVWEGLTNPAIIKEYLHGTETLTDWKPGSEVVFQGDWNGHKYRDHGVVKENIPLKKLSYTYWSGFTGLEDKPENYCLVTYQLDDIGNNQTQFTWVMQGSANEEARQRSENDMPNFMQKLKEVIESK